MTRLCRSCGQELLDSDRFCDECGTAQPTRPSRPEAYRRPAQLVPKTELESLKATLDARIVDLESKLAGSLPRQEADTLHVKLRQLESSLAASIPRREAKAEADSLRVKVAELQGKLAESVPKAELEAKVKELEAKISVGNREIEVARKTIEELEGQLSHSSARTDELQGELSNSVPKTELETIKGKLESKIVDLEAKLAASISRSEADEQASPPKSCPMCNYPNRFDAVFCACCGHMLQSKNGKEKEGMKLVAESPIEEPSPVTITKRGALTADHLGRLSKLKSLLRSGFKSQKNLTLQVPPSVQSAEQLEEQFTKLKSLYDSGALTEAEYQQEKRKLLSEV